MTRPATLRSALFLGEGSSDLPLADIVRGLLLDQGVILRMTAPDLSLIPGRRLRRDVESKVRAGLMLLDGVPDVLVLHRDADTPEVDPRRAELFEACEAVGLTCPLVPIVPVRMTEAWLLLDAQAIRMVAGNPRGRVPLHLPKLGEVERLADPKQLLQESLLAAADATGRRHEQTRRRFPAHRRQLLERLDRSGPVTGLASFRALTDDVARVADVLTSGTA